MAKHSDKIVQILKERDVVVKQLIRLNQALVEATLEEVSNSPALNLPEEFASSGSKQKISASSVSSGRQSWFKRGEAYALIKRLAAKPVHQAELVRALANAKGYSRSLNEMDLKRFHGAAYQAISNSLNRKQLQTNKDGTVVVKP